MKLTDEYEMSKWGYWQCRNGNDTPEMRSLITNKEWIYWYCRYVADIKEMWSKITDNDIAYYYCKKIKDRPEIRKFIKTIPSDTIVNGQRILRKEY